MAHEILFSQWRLEDYDIHSEYGCLLVFPAERFPPGSKLSFLDELAEQMSALTDSEVFQKQLKTIPAWKDSWVEGLDIRLVRRALMIYHFLQNIQVKFQNDEDKASEKPPTKRKPRFISKVLAVPAHRLTQRLSEKRVVKPAVMSYMSYILDNWRVIDPDGPFWFENLEPLVTFNPKPREGEKDHEAGFILTHVVIEKEAATVFRAIHIIYHALIGRNTKLITSSLNKLAQSINEQTAIMRQMPTWCGMFEFRDLIRDWLAIFGDEGVVLEGVGVSKRARWLRGASGAQTAILPSIDAILGIVHHDISDYPDLLNYIHPQHLRFVQMLYEGPILRQYVQQSRSTLLRRVYNDCIKAVLDFRDIHGRVVVGKGRGYIRPTKGQTIDDIIGTGGTKLRPWLDSLIRDTEEHRIR